MTTRRLATLLLGLSLAVLLVGACKKKSAPPSAETPCKSDDCTEQKPAKDAATPEASAPSGADAQAPEVSYDKTCATDADCVPAMGCCPVPCSSLVVNRKELPKIAERNLAMCPKDAQCFSAGGCRTHAYLCVRKTCALVFEDSPDYRPRR